MYNMDNQLQRRIAALEKWQNERKKSTDCFST